MHMILQFWYASLPKLPAYSHPKGFKINQTTFIIWKSVYILVKRLWRKEACRCDNRKALLVFWFCFLNSCTRGLLGGKFMKNKFKQKINSTRTSREPLCQAQLNWDFNILLLHYVRSIFSSSIVYKQLNKLQVLRLRPKETGKRTLQDQKERSVILHSRETKNTKA